MLFAVHAIVAAVMLVH
jgi:hypothetical protein